MGSCLPQDRRARHCIERIAKVELEENLVDVAGITVEPLAGGMHGGLGATRDTDTDLKGPQVVPGFVTRGLTEQLADKPAENFTNSNGPDAPLLFGEGMEGAPSQVRGKGIGGLPSSKNLAKLSKVRCNLVSMWREESFAQVIGSEARGARSRPMLKATDGLGDGLSIKLWHGPRPGIV